MLELIQGLETQDARKGLFLYEDFAHAPLFIPYREFPARVAAAAEHFQSRGVRRGEQVILPFETSPEVIFSFFGLLELGALPLSVKPYILSTPRVTYSEFLDRIAQRYGVRRVLDVPSLSSVTLSLDRLALPPANARKAGVRLRDVSPDELAFVQFSSGSTSFPKGVPITQAHLRENMRLIMRHEGWRSETRCCSWLPLYHDMGLIGSFLSSLKGGHELHQSQPAAFLLDPLGWLEQLGERRASHAVIPNFAIDYALKTLRDADPRDMARLDLSALRTVYLGSEPINIPNMHAFLDLLAPYGLRRNVFMPCYGMAEAVLMVAAAAPSTEPRVVMAPNGQSAVSVGRPLPEFEMRLCAEDGHVCGERELGEVELRGGTLAATYYQDERPLLGESGFYATGDLGFVQDGELYITGRVNDRIKVNGQSYFSPDFEQAVERLPFIRAGRTVVIQVEGKVVVLAEVNHPSALEREQESRRRVCESVMSGVGVTVSPEDVLFIRYGQIQKTSSGKLQRRAISEAYAAGRIRLVTPGALRADLLRMRAERLVLRAVLVVRQQGRRLVTSVRAVLEAGLARLTPKGARRDS